MDAITAMTVTILVEHHVIAIAVITIIHVVAIITITAITMILVIAITFQKDFLTEMKEMIVHVKKRWKEDKQDQISLILIIVRKLVDVKSSILRQKTPIDITIYGSFLTILT